MQNRISITQGIGLIAFSFIVAILVLSPQSNGQAQENCNPGTFIGSWNTDFCQHSVGLGEIIPVVRKDGIPAVDAPKMDTVEEASSWLNKNSPVIAVEIDGEARAYPQAILMWHEIANDEIAGIPIAVTFCPLCNSSIVFDRRVGDDLLSFGVSGNLRNSDMVMYDRETESWWQQFTGEGIVGEYTDELLDILPSRVMGFGQFKDRNPDGLVMSPDTGHSRQYGLNPYAGYDTNPEPFLYGGDIDLLVSRFLRRKRSCAKWRGLIEKHSMPWPPPLSAPNMATSE